MYIRIPKKSLQVHIYYMYIKITIFVRTNLGNRFHLNFINVYKLVQLERYNSFDSDKSPRPWMSWLVKVKADWSSYWVLKRAGLAFSQCRDKYIYLIPLVINWAGYKKDTWESPGTNHRLPHILPCCLRTGPAFALVPDSNYILCTYFYRATR